MPHPKCGWRGPLARTAAQAGSNSSFNAAGCDEITSGDGITRPDAERVAGRISSSWI
jgi:hypothetical protein